MAKALEAAPRPRQNWAAQKEPADVRIFLEATLAAREQMAARPLLEWLTRHHVEDLHAAI